MSSQKLLKKNLQGGEEGGRSSNTRVLERLECVHKMCPHFRGCYVQASMELGPEDVSLLERWLCKALNKAEKERRKVCRGVKSTVMDCAVRRIKFRAEHTFSSYHVKGPILWGRPGPTRVE